MTPRQIDLVRSTWSAVIPIQDMAAEIFYNRLFELDPSLKALFPEDLSEQRKKLMQTIGTAIAHLKDLSSVLPAVQALGVRHLDYKVTEPMYATVGQALLDTLEKGLGDAWNEETEEAWALTYTTLANAMTEAARKAGSGPKLSTESPVS